MMPAIVLVAVLAIGVLIGITILHKHTSGLDLEFFKTSWQNIERLSGNKDTWVQAIVDADKLLDEALKGQKYVGNTLADRMVSAGRAFSNSNNVWTAHKIRNKVVHESKFKLTKRHVTGSMKGYKQALKDLGAL